MRSISLRSFVTSLCVVGAAAVLNGLIFLGARMGGSRQITHDT